MFSTKLHVVAFIYTPGSANDEMRRPGRDGLIGQPQRLARTFVGNIYGQNHRNPKADAD